MISDWTPFSSQPGGPWQAGAGGYEKYGRMYILYIYIYIRRPLLVRGHQAAREVGSITDLLSYLFFNIQSADYQSLSVFHDHSAIDQSAVD